MLRHRTRIRVARLLLSVLLFAQAAIAMAGCDWLRAAPALAIAQSANQAPCHEAPAINANVCLAHCLSADQSTDTPQVVVPARVDCAPITIAAIDRRVVSVVDLQFMLPRPSAPPPRILFQSFLI